MDGVKTKNNRTQPERKPAERNNSNQEYRDNLDIRSNIKIGEEKRTKNREKLYKIKKLSGLIARR